MNFKLTNGKDQDFIHLCARLDAYLNHIAGGEDNRKVYVSLNARDGIDDVYVAYSKDTPIACGGFKHYSDGIAEVKRVFVEKAHRGKGLAKQTMRLLEAKAKQKGYNKVIVETGRDMTGAVNLYQSLGYATIPNYGHYKGLQNSICMEKQL